MVCKSAVVNTSSLPEIINTFFLKRLFAQLGSFIFTTVLPKLAVKFSENNTSDGQLEEKIVPLEHLQVPMLTAVRSGQTPAMKSVP